MTNLKSFDFVVEMTLKPDYSKTKKLLEPDEKHYKMSTLDKSIFFILKID